SVHHAVDVGDQLLFRNQGRMHTQLHILVSNTGDTQMLDAVAQLFGIHDVSSGDLADTFGVDFVELQRNTKSIGRQNGQLVRSVNTFNVEGRISFGITQLLCFFQHFREITFALAHLGQNKVAGTVNDTGQPVNGVCRQTFTQSLDDRDTTSHRTFIGNGYALLARGFKNSVAVNSNQRLVGGDYVLAVFDGLQHQIQSRIKATHQLDYNINVRITCHVKHISADPDSAFGQSRIRTTGCDMDNFEVSAYTAGN